MLSLFEAYDLLSKSGLFDAAFYLRKYPDIAALNVDPLTHYLETGCHERRNPSAAFDTPYYLRQCGELGEAPDNALVHYLTVGAARGLRAKARSADDAIRESADRSVKRPTPQAAEVANTAASMGSLYVDVPSVTNGVADAPVHGGLSIAGWALAPKGIERVDVALDGKRVAVAFFGIRRPDVASAHPDREGAMQSGFAAHVPPKALSAGRHVVIVTAYERNAGSTSKEFAIDVEELADSTGPWSLRTKMGQVEADAQLALLAALNWRPRFRVYAPLGPHETDLLRLRQTLATLSRQRYVDWHLELCPTAGFDRLGLSTAGPLKRLADEFEECAEQVSLCGDLKGTPESVPGAFVLSVAAGDLFACDALLEFALASGFERRLDFAYCDERRLNPADGKTHAFFKPQWSPDLALATNYVGRAWCATAALVTGAALTIKDLVTRPDYDLVLRLTEVAGVIRHVARVLVERSEAQLDDVPAEERSLKAALARRKIVAEVLPGCLPHHYRVKRKTSKRELVSIIIPTCAAGGLVQTCIDSLRDKTAYRSYEIVCIENIPKDRQPWKKWLAKNADVVVSINERFNWSRFNNRAAGRAKGKYLLFLNDDIEVIDPFWLEALLEQVQRPEVGVVGPQLLYPDRSVQHAGMTLDSVGRGRHIFRHLQADDPGYFGMALTQRNVISLTGACLMTRRDIFERLGRFERAHAVINGDLDYCLKSWDAGLLNVYVPQTRLIHHELASRSKLQEQFNATVFKRRWRETILRGDPYFNPQLSLEHDQVEIEREPVEEIYPGHPLFEKAAIRRILVIKLDHIGDTITAMPSVRRLRRVFPDANITALAGRGTLALWRAEASVDEVIEFNFFHVRSGLGTIKVKEDDISVLSETLKKKRFDLAIDLRKQPDTRHILELSGAQYLAGFDHHGRFPWLDIAIEWDEDVPLRAKRAHVSEDLDMLVDTVQARCEPAAPIPLPPQGDLALPAGVVRRLFSRPVVCVHAAAGSPMRQWALPKFSELIDMLLADGNVNVAIIGGPDEGEVADGVLKGVDRRKQVFNFVGKISISDLSRLLGRAALFVGNNSGPQHLAASLGTPTIGIHSGVVDAHEWGPLGPRAMAVRRQMSCSPCFIEKPKDCPRALACLTGLESRDIYGRCRRMLLLTSQSREQGGSATPRRKSSADL